MDPAAPASELTGQTALVTGTGRANGLGRAVAAGLRAAGARVLCHARNRRTAEEAAEAVCGLAVWGDLAGGDGVDEIAHATLELTDALHVLVHNAAINPRPGEAFDAVDREVFEQVLAVNALAPLFLTQALLGPLHRAQPPARIVFVSSHIAQTGTELVRGYY